ncbi:MULTISPECIES: hypothetical protein [Nonomuraea]|uniref:Uncharacterized protein n=1 Tax=Nonomuraea mangrovi TaxID=2316207 RepID=A0ABW4TBU5_9ACTN
MSVTMLPGGVLRVPTVTTLDNGTQVDGTRDITPDSPDYEAYLPYAVGEDEQWHEDAEDAAILARWRARASA